jgi:hypothetical protein
LVTGANAINATLYEKLNFNFISDIAPVASISRETFALEVNPSFPAKTVPEFIAHAKANPGKLTMASGGIGTATHVSGELFKMMAGIKMVHVPYRGLASALTDLLGGQVQVAFGLNRFLLNNSPRGPALTVVCKFCRWNIAVGHFGVRSWSIEQVPNPDSRASMG